jgi:hypothetical protein
LLPLLIVASLIHLFPAVAPREVLGIDSLQLPEGDGQTS